MNWVKVEDGLPKRIEGKSYSQVPCLVVMRGNKYVETLVFNHENMCWDTPDYDDYHCDINEVEFWMPFPEPPTK